MKKRLFLAFSLIELLLVMSILSILLALIVPAFNSIGRSQNITMATQLLIDEFTAARQMALSQNRQVEFRFYDAKSEDGDPSAFRAFRFFLLDQNGINPTPMDRVNQLPKGVIISRNAQFSTLEGTPALNKDTTQETLPVVGAVDYRYFRFRPNGSTDLDASTQWFWTLRSLNDKASQSVLPANFASVQLDPVTGHPRIFRP